jgi:hypothetical protein
MGWLHVRLGHLPLQIMLAGGVLTSLTMSESAFKLFDKYNSSGVVFDTDETLEQAADLPIYRHAVFCYGWWDNPKDAGDGYWLCKNRWAVFGQLLNMPISYHAELRSDLPLALLCCALLAQKPYRGIKDSKCHVELEIKVCLGLRMQHQTVTVQRLYDSSRILWDCLL